MCQKGMETWAYSIGDMARRISAKSPMIEDDVFTSMSQPIFAVNTTAHVDAATSRSFVHTNLTTVIIGTCPGRRRRIDVRHHPQDF